MQFSFWAIINVFSIIIRFSSADWPSVGRCAHPQPLFTWLKIWHNAYGRSVVPVLVTSADLRLYHSKSNASARDSVSGQCLAVVAVRSPHSHSASPTASLGLAIIVLIAFYHILLYDHPHVY